MTLVVVRDGLKLAPAYRSDLDKLQKLKPGQQYLLKSSSPRLLKHHCKLFAIMRLCLENGIWDRIGMDTAGLSKKEQGDRLLFLLKWEFLPRQKLKTASGEFVEVVSSVSFENMDQEAFSAFYVQAVAFLAKVMGVTSRELEENHGEFM